MTTDRRWKLHQSQTSFINNWTRKTEIQKIGKRRNSPNKQSNPWKKLLHWWWCDIWLLTVSSVLKSDVFYTDCDSAYFGLSLGIFHFTVLQHCSSTSLCFQLVINFAWVLQTKPELTLQRKSQSSCKLSAKLWYFFDIESSESVFVFILVLFLVSDFFPELSLQHCSLFWFLKSCELLHYFLKSQSSVCIPAAPIFFPFFNAKPL